MASFTPSPDPKGTLVVELRSPTITEVFFIPDDKRLEAADIDPADGATHRVRILTFSAGDGWVTIEPKTTLHGHAGFLQPKYDQIERIRIEESGGTFDSGEDLPETVEDVCEALSNLPAAFTKNPDYGLGLAKQYRFIIDAVEKLSDCTVLHITSDGDTRIDTDESVFYISERDFDDYSQDDQ